MLWQCHYRLAFTWFTLTTAALIFPSGHLVLAQLENTCPPPDQITVEPAEPTHELDRQARLDLANWVHSLIRDNYIDPNFGGLDWDALRRELEPSILAAESDQEVYALLSEMVEHLDDTRSIFRSPEELRAAEEAFRNIPRDFVGIGVNFRFSEDYQAMLVQQVFPGGPAEEAGIQRRDRILAVNGEPCPTASKIRGPEGSSLTLTVRSPGEAPREITLERRPVVGQAAPLERRLGEDRSIGYLWIPTLTDDMPDQVHEVLSRMLSELDMRGLVLDLRGAGASRIEVVADVAGLFGVANIGYYRSRMATTPIEQSRRWTGPYHERLRGIPLVVLVDGGSAPGAAMLAAALQHHGRARIVGSQTTGDMLIGIPYELYGARLTVAETEFVLPGNTRLTGIGVTPDVEIDVDWTEYSEEEDPVILRALELFQEEVQKDEDFVGEVSCRIAAAAKLECSIL